MPTRPCKKQKTQEVVANEEQQSISLRKDEIVKIV